MTTPIDQSRRAARGGGCFNYVGPSVSLICIQGIRPDTDHLLDVGFRVFRPARLRR